MQKLNKNRNISQNNPLNRYQNTQTMKKLALILSFCISISQAQTKKENQVLAGLSELNEYKVGLSIDSTLTKEAQDFAAIFTNDMDAETVSNYFNYNTPSQKYFCYITFTDKKYNGKDIANFFWGQDQDFYNMCQYKSKVGIVANDKICIVLFYKNKNVLTVTN